MTTIKLSLPFRKHPSGLKRSLSCRLTIPYPVLSPYQSKRNNGFSKDLSHVSRHPVQNTGSIVLMYNPDLESDSLVSTALSEVIKDLVVLIPENKCLQQGVRSRHNSSPTEVVEGSSDQSFQIFGH